jgi:hypothetical protein
LVDKTAAFNIHLNITQNKGITSASPEQMTNALVSWIVQNDKDATVDWNNTAIIYITDYGNQGFGGVHEDDQVQHFDIPWALITVTDQNWTITLSHEVLELLADPWGSRFVVQSQYPISGWPSQDWIVEVCDACEAEALAYAGTGGVLVSDFVLPAYFNISIPAATPLDFKGHLFRNTKLQPTAQFPFPMNQGGYLSFINPTTNDFRQITWFTGPKPVYTNPDADESNSRLVGKHCNSRLAKYIANHRGIHGRRSRYLGGGDAAEGAHHVFRPHAVTKKA